MVVEYINKISDENKLYYMGIIVASLLFFSEGYVPTISFIVAIIVGFSIIYYDNDKNNNSIENLNKNLHYKLVSLMEHEEQNTPLYFHLEPDMINFFYDIRDFRVYNRDSYAKAIKNIDLILKIKKDLENDYRYISEPKLSGWQNFGDMDKPRVKSNITTHKEMFEKAEILAEKSINYVHSFVISLPVHQVYRTKHRIALEKFHLLTKRILDKILLDCTKNTNNPLIGQDYGLPKPTTPKDDSFNYIKLS